MSRQDKGYQNTRMKKIHFSIFSYLMSIKPCLYKARGDDLEKGSYNLKYFLFKKASRQTVFSGTYWNRLENTGRAILSVDFPFLVDWPQIAASWCTQGFFMPLVCERGGESWNYNKNAIKLKIDPGQRGSLWNYTKYVIFICIHMWTVVSYGGKVNILKSPLVVSFWAAELCWQSLSNGDPWKPVNLD